MLLIIGHAFLLIHRILFLRGAILSLATNKNLRWHMAQEFLQKHDQEIQLTFYTVDSLTRNVVSLMVESKFWKYCENFDGGTYRNQLWHLAQINCWNVTFWMENAQSIYRPPFPCISCLLHKTVGKAASGTSEIREWLSAQLMDMLTVAWILLKKSEKRLFLFFSK